MKERILALAVSTPGLTDREVTDRLVGALAGQQAINKAARARAVSGQIVHRQRGDGKLANYPGVQVFPEAEMPIAARCDEQPPAMLSEDDVKAKLQT